MHTLHIIVQVTKSHMIGVIIGGYAGPADARPCHNVYIGLAEAAGVSDSGGLQGQP